MENTRAAAPPQAIHCIHDNQFHHPEPPERDTYESLPVVYSESESESQSIARPRACERDGLGVDSCYDSRDDDGVDDESHDRQCRCKHRRERGEQDEDADGDEGEDECECRLGGFLSVRDVRSRGGLIDLRRGIRRR
jgi:hypothetical protein